MNIFDIPYIDTDTYYKRIFIKYLFGNTLDVLIDDELKDLCFAFKLLQVGKKIA